MQCVTLLTLFSLSLLAWNRSHRSFASLTADRYASTRGPANAKVPANAKAIDWVLLRHPPVEPGLVRIPGFVVPLEDGHEFLLVPSRACAHTQAPPANQTVLVRLAAAIPAKAARGEAVWVYGRLRTGSPGGKPDQPSYEIDSDLVEPYDN